MMASPNSFTRSHGGAAIASTFGVDRARLLAFARLSVVPAVVFSAIGERQLVAGLTERATKE
jgi:ABC-type glycerol-3-phosphate transport system permease component